MKRSYEVKIVGALGAVAAAGAGGAAAAAVRLAAAAAAAAAAARRQAADANGGPQPVRRQGRHAAFANSGDWDSLDPADTYYAYSWNFARLYGRSLVMFKSAPGQGGRHARARPRRVARHAQRRRQDLDLHAAQGRQVRGRHPGHQQGRQVRRRAVAGQDDVPERPHLLQRLPRPAGLHQPLQGPRPGQAGPEGDRDPGRPDDRLPPEAKPFSGFDYFAQLPADDPGAAAKDTGSKYKEHVVSTGPYMFETNDLGKSFTLVRNPNWDPATDPNRKALPDRIEVALNVNSDDIDNRLHVRRPRRRRRGHRCRPAAQGKILADQTLKANTDSALQRAHLVHRDQRRRRAAGQHPLPQGRRVRGRPDRLPARLRRRDRRRHRHQPPAAGDPGRASSSTPTRRRTTPGDLAKAKDELTAVRAAQRLHHQHLLPRRAARRRRPPPRRCSSRWPGSGIKPRRSSPTRWATTSSCTRASRTSRRRTTSA